LAKHKIPGPLERRHLIEKSQDVSKSLVIAEAYLEAGRAVEALEFLANADAQERLAELRATAMREGDAFLLRGVATAAAQPVTVEEWSSLATAAAEAGKDCYAAEARRQADRGED
jgi:hypothetical protein